METTDSKISYKICYSTLNRMCMVFDGGFGSTLESLGYEANKYDLWSGEANINAIDMVYKVHDLFIRAGAQIITTNTYHCSIQKMIDIKNYNLEQAENVIKSAVNFAKECILKSEKNLVLVGSVGPYATYLRDGSEYTGNYIKKINPQIITNYYLQQIKPLIESGIKTLVFETIPTIAEIQSVGEVLSTLDDSIDAWITVTCQDKKKLRSGEKFIDAIKLINLFSKVKVVGINCTSPLHITELLNFDKNLKQKPIVVYPNSGETYNQKTKDFNNDTCTNHIFNSIPVWYELGARIFGGCCRVLPSDLNEIAKLVNKLNINNN